MFSFDENQWTLFFVQQALHARANENCSFFNELEWDEKCFGITKMHKNFSPLSDLFSGIHIKVKF